MLKKLLLSVLFIVLLSGSFSPYMQEGMYPLSEMSGLNLNEAGLKIDPSEIYNPDGVSLIDALVKLNGCTASFVSNDGLIVTNHHCAFGAINNASTPENNYLENGFLAKTRADEVPATGYTCRITESYEDVSDEVLNAVEDIKNPAERNKAIKDKMEEISKRETDEENSIVAKVSEMFAGKTYVLFRYRNIKDVRLVYAPPRSVGEFGGETDNWVWPRHTGDFSFMRAYVAKDGSAAEYSEDNVPYTPKKFLQVNPDGVNDGDFVFILGYPGRTYRNKPAEYIEYQFNYQLPYIQKTYKWMIDKLEEIAGDDEALKLKFATKIKRLANVEKNYRGKMLGIRRIELVEKKKAEQEKLREFVNSNDEMNEKYGELFQNIDDVYKDEFKYAKSNLWMSTLLRRSDLMNAIHFVYDYANEKQKEDSERKSKFRDDNFNKSVARFNGYVNGMNLEFERAMIKKMFTDALTFEGDAKIMAVEALVKDNAKEDINRYVDNLIAKLEENPSLLNDMLGKDVNELVETEKGIFGLMVDLYDQTEELIKINNTIDGKLNTLSAQLFEVKRMWQKKAFVPDANGTLRLTYGNIKGYSPADAMYYSPISTLEGVMDKGLRGNNDWIVPEKLKAVYAEKDFGRFYDEDLESVPVAILYNTDTTGGNSGSPILDAYGRLIGINFDRAFEATINDFAWNDSYSRSIGVDIRYVLFITQKIGGADFLLEEMGVK